MAGCLFPGKYGILRDAAIYGYTDDPSVLLCWAGALEFLKADDWPPDVINRNDWHTGYFKLPENRLPE
jgi:glycogen synthase